MTAAIDESRSPTGTSGSNSASRPALAALWSAAAAVPDPEIPVLSVMDLGILLFMGAVIFQTITLPVEFNASKRALAQLTSLGVLAPEEVSGAKKVLDAAALTYVASAAMAALQLLRLLVLRNSRD